MVKIHERKSKPAELGCVLKAIADPHRRQILSLLAERDMPVSRIAGRFRISRPAVIKHLKVLRSARLVSARRCGRENIQSLNVDPLKSVETWLSRFGAFWENSLDKLKHQIESES